MVEYLGPKIFTIFTILTNSLIGAPFSQIIYYNILPALLVVILVIFWVIKNIKFAFFSNLVICALGAIYCIVMLIYNCLYPAFDKKEYNNMGYPISYLDHVNLQQLLSYIGFYTLLIVVNLGNIAIYLVHYLQEKDEISISGQLPILEISDAAL